MAAPEAPSTFTAFSEFHTQLLERAETQGSWPGAVADAADLGSFAMVTPIGAVTWEVRNDGGASVLAASVSPATELPEAKVILQLDTTSWWGLMNDFETIPGIVYGGKGTVQSGSAGRALRWEAPLRSVLHDIPIYEPSSIDLRDADGSPLTTDRSFALAEIQADPASARHFLQTAGYLAVRNVFSREEVEMFLADTTRLASEAREGDQASWWGKNASGDAVLTRVLNGSSRPNLRSLVDDPRVRSIVDCFGEPMVVPAPDDLDGVTVIYKQPNMVEGLADLPWHRDCGMGGHAHMCPCVVMSIYVTEGTAESGELRVLPGSHRTSAPFIDERTSPGLGIGIPMRAGDVSLHITDVLHASMPPTSSIGPHRVAILLGFTRPQLMTHTEALRHYNDALLGATDGQVARLGG